MITHADDMASVQARVACALRDVPDFPKPGILFKDITPILGDADLFSAVVDGLCAPWMEAGITHVAGIESRGFIFGAPLALALGGAFIPIRKPGKLPYRTLRRTYELEYGSDQLEMHVDACTAESRVLLVDDVLATGGTAAAACALIEQAGATVVGCSFLVAIGALDGATRLEGRHTIVTLVT